MKTKKHEYDAPKVYAKAEAFAKLVAALMKEINPKIKVVSDAEPGGHGCGFGGEDFSFYTDIRLRGFETRQVILSITDYGKKMEFNVRFLGPQTGFFGGENAEEQLSSAAQTWLKIEKTLPSMLKYLFKTK